MSKIKIKLKNQESLRKTVTAPSGTPIQSILRTVDIDMFEKFGGKF